MDRGARIGQAQEGLLYRLPTQQGIYSGAGGGRAWRGMDRRHEKRLRMGRESLSFGTGSPPGKDAEGQGLRGPNVWVKSDGRERDNDDAFEPFEAVVVREFLERYDRDPRNRMRPGAALPFPVYGRRQGSLKFSQFGTAQYRWQRMTLKVQKRIGGLFCRGDQDRYI